MAVSEGPGELGVKAGRSLSSKTDEKILARPRHSRRPTPEFVIMCGSFHTELCAEHVGDLSPRATQDTGYSKSMHYMM